MSPVNRVSCLDVNDPFADGSATQMLRLPSASKIHATLAPLGEAVSPLGKGALSPASRGNAGPCAAAILTAMATLTTRTRSGRTAMRRIRLRCLISGSMAGELGGDATGGSS